MAAWPNARMPTAEPGRPAGDHVHALQRIGSELVLRIDFQHHVILIQGLIDGRDLFLAERVIEDASICCGVIPSRERRSRDR